LSKIAILIISDQKNANLHTSTINIILVHVVESTIATISYQSVKIMADFPDSSHLLLLITFVSLVDLTPVNKSDTILIYARFLMHLPKLQLSGTVDLA
jgi:hypothetical protein